MRIAAIAIAIVNSDSTTNALTTTKYSNIVIVREK